MWRRSVLFGFGLLVAAVVGNIEKPAAHARPGIRPPRVHTATVHREVEVRVSDEVTVRLKHAPKQFDDKGKPVIPTAEQLQAMKGDSKLPGYAADYGDLKPGQIVTVHLGRHKAPKPEEQPQAGADKKPEKPRWTSLGEVTGRLVRMEGQSAPVIKGNGKKKPREAGETERKLILEVDSTILVRGNHNPGEQKKTILGDDVFATWVMIRSTNDANGEAAKK